jgi:hypothetical protein
VGEIVSGAVAPFGATLGLSYHYRSCHPADGRSYVRDYRLCPHGTQQPSELDLDSDEWGDVPLLLPRSQVRSAFSPAPLTLYFSVVEVIAVAIAVALAAYIAIDGVTSWLEGAQLLALWGILALWFYFYQPLPLLVFL